MNRARVGVALATVGLLVGGAVVGAPSAWADYPPAPIPTATAGPAPSATPSASASPSGSATPSASATSSVRPATPSAPLTSKVIANPASRTRIGPRVTVLAASKVPGADRIAAKKAPTAQIGLAPLVKVPLRSPVRIKVKGIPGGSRAAVTASLWVEGRIVRLGAARANRKGTIVLPAMRFGKARSYLLTLVVADGERSHLRLGVN